MDAKLATGTKEVITKKPGQVGPVFINLLIRKCI